MFSTADFIRYMARHLVDSPGDVSVKVVEGNHTSIFELKVAKLDIGKVIGKKGRTVSALRTILKAVSSKEKNQPAILEIIE